MITGFYEGGLGNQMFQIAAGISLANNNNDSYIINKNGFIGKGQGNHLHSYLNNIFKNIPSGYPTISSIHQETSNCFEQILYKKDLALRGFFESYKYIENNKNYIRKIFNFDWFENNYKQTKKLLTIHIRTGDKFFNLSLKHLHIINKKYFQNCLDRIDLKDYTILVVSDYPEIAKDFLPNIDYSFYTKGELQELFLMTQSDACIISNSTFSWWGSFLGKNKTTYAPYKWCEDPSKYQEIYRPDMIRVEY